MSADSSCEDPVTAESAVVMHCCAWGFQLQPLNGGALLSGSSKHCSHSELEDSGVVCVVTVLTAAVQQSLAQLVWKGYSKHDQRSLEFESTGGQKKLALFKLHIDR